mmetsp:Transcript_23118/g.58983  ORF Transcript_23118/g.58983 Transcript_23118/m.58983 type:complete len:218 (+) Transcript_23118:222-875(+)
MAIADTIDRRPHGPIQERHTRGCCCQAEQPSEDDDVTACLRAIRLARIFLREAMDLSCIALRLDKIVTISKRARVIAAHNFEVSPVCPLGSPAIAAEPVVVALVVRAPTHDRHDVVDATVCFRNRLLEGAQHALRVLLRHHVALDGRRKAVRAIVMLQLWGGQDGTRDGAVLMDLVLHRGLSRYRVWFARPQTIVLQDSVAILVLVTRVAMWPTHHA